ncbi:MAG: pyruvate dehydrogenase (acetyl-transferring) E1 component subunit alpha [Acidimicrobiia bacterium]|nr:pyruvate dehydrogenase (acetyl-transferring) E1 component subunit alpha [Acidimicrobiia bacterium]
MEPFQILAPDGTVTGDPGVDLDQARFLFSAMVAARAYDRKGSALQRQGRLATYAPFEGQEAAQVGATAALRSDDWLVATYRDAAAMWMQGYPWVNLLLGRMGDERGGQAPEGVNVLPPSITVGGHMIHAVGIAWAERLQGTDRVALTTFGDGATSEGDFHEAMNFAAVYEAPVVFLCQNNGWAISLPRERQTRADTLADKAVGYGMPGMVVDGNDVFAVGVAVGDAVARARSGDGPTFVEALTYRVGPHTTADDPGRYRTDDEAEEWRGRDPIDRLRRYLRDRDAWTQAWEDGVAEEVAAEVEAAVEEGEALEPFAPGEIFEGMFERTTAVLEAQRAALLRDLGEG